jgi:hypothetical protein
MPPEVGQYSVGFLVGGVVGLVGQLVRVLIGIRSYTDGPPATRRAARVFVLLLLGIMAGGLSALAFPWGDMLERGELLGLLAAGYAGPDFVEELMHEFLPGGDST